MTLIKGRSWSLDIIGTKVELKVNHELVISSLIEPRRKHFLSIDTNNGIFQFDDEFKQLENNFKLNIGKELLIDNEDSGESENDLKINGIWLGEERLGLFDSESNSYMTKVVLNGFDQDYESSEIEPIIVSNSELIFISIASAILVILFSFLGLIIIFCARKICSSRNKNDNNNTKFNSRNKLEISVNSSQNCSSTPSSMSSSSLSGVTATQSLSRNTLNSGYIAVKTSSNAVIADASKLDKFQSDANYLDYELFPGNQSSKTKSSDFFTPSEFDLIKHTLNWTPSYDQFKMVIGDFQQFSPPVTNFEENFNENFCKKYNNDRQTFV